MLTDWDEVDSLGADDDNGVEVGEPDSKQSLLDEARDYDPVIAIGEFIDNTFGNYESTYLLQNEGEGLQAPVLRINIDFQTAEDVTKPEITYTENSGGVPYKKLGSFVSRTWTDWKELPYPVGAWGRGQLVAFAYFGRHNIVRTFHFDENLGRIFEFGSSKEPVGVSPSSKDPRDYYVPTNTHWNVKIYEDRREALSDGRPSAGETTFVIRKITPEALAAVRETEFFSDLTRDLCKYYANQVRNLNKLANEINNTTNQQMIELTISGAAEYTLFGENAKAEPKGNAQSLGLFHGGDFEEIAKNMVRVPTLPPRWVEFDVPIKDLHHSYSNSKETLTVEILCGFMDTCDDDFTKHYRGFMLWGNQRLFEESYVPALIPTLKSFQNNLKGKELSHHRWKGFVKISSPKPDLLPWSRPMKWGFRDNFVWRKTLDIILTHSLMPFFVAANKVYSSSPTFKKDNLPKYFQMFNPYTWDQVNLETFQAIEYTDDDLTTPEKKNELIHRIGNHVLTLNENQIRQAIADHFASSSIGKETPSGELENKELSIDNIKSPTTSWACFFHGNKNFTSITPTSNISDWQTFVVDADDNPTEFYHIHWKTLVFWSCPDAFFKKK